MALLLVGFCWLLLDQVPWCVPIAYIDFGAPSCTPPAPTTAFFVTNHFHHLITLLSTITDIFGSLGAFQLSLGTHTGPIAIAYCAKPHHHPTRFDCAATAFVAHLLCTHCASLSACLFNEHSDLPSAPIDVLVGASCCAHSNLRTHRGKTVLVV